MHSYVSSSNDIIRTAFRGQDEKSIQCFVNQN